MTVLLLALLLGVVAGLRAMMAPAAATWIAHAGALEDALAIGASLLVGLAVR